MFEVRPFLFSGLLLCVAALLSCGQGPVEYAQKYVPNGAPVIQSFTSDFPVGETPEPGMIVTISVTAQDPDGDPITCSFDSGNGSFVGQTTSGDITTVTFIVGTITGGETVAVTARLSDPKGFASSQSLPLGTSSLGPAITVTGSVITSVAADGFSSIIFRSGSDGYFQVAVLDDATGIPVCDPKRSFFQITKNTDTRVDICGPLYTGPLYVEGIPKLFAGIDPDKVRIIVRDGMKQESPLDYVFTVEGMAPVPGDSGNVNVFNVSMNGCTLSWTKATDNETAQGSLEYKAVYSLSNNISSVAEAEANGIVALDWTANTAQANVTGLSPSTPYWFNVLVRDGDGVVVAYQMTGKSTNDGSPPTPGNSGKVFESSVTDTALRISWTKAADNETLPGNLQYRVYRSDTANIGSVGGIEAYGRPVSGWLTDADYYDAAGISDAYKKYYNVMVRDELGNLAAYDMVEPPTISSFTTAHKTILTTGGGNVQTSTGLTVVASDPGGSIAAYSYEVVSGGGSLSGTDTAAGKIYNAGAAPGTAQLRVTVTDDSGAVAKSEVNVTVRQMGYQKISETEGGFGGSVNGSHFGSSMASIGDLDGDGVSDIAVGASYDSDGGSNRGAVWILFMKSDGTVKSYQKISDIAGGFTGVLDDQDRFGMSVAAIGDLDGDGVMDIAVGANQDDDGGTDRGAVWILLLNANGTVKSNQKINDIAGGFTGVLDDYDSFGMSVAAIGDLDGDGVMDIAVGAYRDDDGGTDRGAVWILFLNANGTVKSSQKISDTAGSFTGVLDDDNGFGFSICSIGDLDGDGVTDIAVGALFDDDGGTQLGALWILFLNANGTVKSYQKVSATSGGFTGVLDEYERFGISLTSIGDLDGDGITDIIVGAFDDDDGGTNRGAVWVLFLNDDGSVKSHQKISDTEGYFTGTLIDNSRLGRSVSNIGDLDGDGVAELIVGTEDINNIWVLFMNPDGTVMH